MALLIEPLPTERDLRKLRWEKSNKKLNETSIVRKTLAGVASQKRRIPNGRVACRVSRVAWRGVARYDVARRGIAWRRAVARIPRTAPLSSNYRSNGVSLGVDPTPASICRLALIQLPRRQLPRWYTCGRFIASTVIRVRRSLLSFHLSAHLSTPRARYSRGSTLACFLVRSSVSVSRRRAGRSAFQPASFSSNAVRHAAIRWNTKNSLASRDISTRVLISNADSSSRRTFEKNKPRRFDKASFLFLFDICLISIVVQFVFLFYHLYDGMFMIVHKHAVARAERNLSRIPMYVFATLERACVF